MSKMSELDIEQKLRELDRSYEDIIAEVFQMVCPNESAGAVVDRYEVRKGRVQAAIVQHSGGWTVVIWDHIDEALEVASYDKAEDAEYRYYEFLRGDNIQAHDYTDLEWDARLEFAAMSPHGKNHALLLRRDDPESGRFHYVVVYHRFLTEVDELIPFDVEVADQTFDTWEPAWNFFVSVANERSNMDPADIDIPEPYDDDDEPFEDPDDSDPDYDDDPDWRMWRFP